MKVTLLKSTEVVWNNQKHLNPPANVLHVVSVLIRSDLSESGSMWSSADTLSISF